MDEAVRANRTDRVNRGAVPQNHAPGGNAHANGFASAFFGDPCEVVGGEEVEVGAGVGVGGRFDDVECVMGSVEDCEFFGSVGVVEDEASLEEAGLLVGVDVPPQSVADVHGGWKRGVHSGADENGVGVAGQFVFMDGCGELEERVELVLGQNVEDIGSCELSEFMDGA